MRFSSRRLINLLILLLLLGGVALWNSRSRQTPAATPAQPAQGQPTTAAPASEAPAATAEPDTARGNRNLRLGNPSAATHDASQPNNYLIERPQYALSYNRDHGTPNWVSWQITASDLGDVQRSNIFDPDTTLPKGWYQVKTGDYTGSGYDRGHMCPSADRSATQEDNQATFTLTNIVPQAPDNNRVTWEHLEALSRTLVHKGHVLYVIAGGDGSNGTIAKGKILVPGYTWKIIVVMPVGTSDITKISADTPVIAVRIPNQLGVKINDWDSYRVKIADIEAASGYHFLTNLPPEIQQALKSKVDPAPIS
ncbi:MAG: DNA/RNA non-specific endonuclease [Chloroflexales bacterium]